MIEKENCEQVGAELYLVKCVPSCRYWAEPPSDYVPKEESSRAEEFHWSLAYLRFCPVVVAGDRMLSLVSGQSGKY